MKKFAFVGCLTLSLTALVPAVAAQQSTPDPDLAKFRADYTSGDGLAYVVIPDEKGQHVYRYGEASRSAAKKSPRGYMLFTCSSTKVFLPQKPEHKAALLKAEVVKREDPRFVELDGKYLAECRNPLVKSAIAKKKS
jgi:hypothetical protein